MALSIPLGRGRLGHFNFGKVQRERERERERERAAKKEKMTTLTNEGGREKLTARLFGGGGGGPGAWQRARCSSFGLSRPLQPYYGRVREGVSDWQLQSTPGCSLSDSERSANIKCSRRSNVRKRIIFYFHRLSHSMPTTNSSFLPSEASDLLERRHRKSAYFKCSSPRN